MVSMVQAHASYRGRCCRRLARERTHRLANRKFAFNRIFGEGKENLNVLRKKSAHAHDMHSGCFLYDETRWSSTPQPLIIHVPRDLIALTSD
jgi:hypothetical protein